MGIFQLTTSETEVVALRAPHARDGVAIAALIAASPPLDANSTYCVLLQCTHFAATCILAELEGRPLGWVSAYVPPTQPDSLFVWQVAVAQVARGTGLAERMLDALVARQTLAGLAALRTTITAGNTASWRLFESFARRQGSTLNRAPLFERDAHFAGRQATEFELVIALKRGADRKCHDGKE